MNSQKGTYSLAQDLRGLMDDHEVHPSESYLEVIGCHLAQVISYNTPAMQGLVRTLLSSPQMMAFNLLQNAVDEAKGGTRVRIIAERYAQGDLRSQMLSHADDEFRHARQFLGLIKFTGLQTRTEHDGSIEETQKVFDFDDDLRLFIARVHSIEIRSWTILRLYIDVLQAQPDSNLKGAIPVLRQILADEARHVAYTGRQLSNWLDESSDFSKQTQACFAHTNNETWEDFARMARYLADNHEAALLRAPSSYTAKSIAIA